LLTCLWSKKQSSHNQWSYQPLPDLLLALTEPFGVSLSWAARLGSTQVQLFGLASNVPHPARLAKEAEHSLTDAH